MEPWLQRAFVIVVLAGSPFLAFSAVFSDDQQARFDHESNSVHKAKLFEKLGDEQLASTRRASQSGDFATVGQVMEKYRDNARAALDALKKEHPNAERQLNGYKQLQMHIRKALRDLKEVLLLAPGEYKPPLQLVDQDLASMDDELLRMLFPQRPGAKKPPAVPPAATAEPPPGGPDQAADKPAEQPAPKPEANQEDNSEANQPAENAIDNTEEKAE